MCEQTTDGFDFIRDRQQVESALRQFEERYRTLFESIDEGFCVIEVLFDENDTPNNYRFLEVNPAFENQTGLQQVTGKTARQLVLDIEDRWIKIHGKIALTGESLRFENCSEAMNRWFDLYAFRIGQPRERKVAVLFKQYPNLFPMRSSAILGCLRWMVICCCAKFVPYRKLDKSPL